MGTWPGFVITRGDQGIVVEGELDMATAPLLEADLAEVNGPVRLDLAGLTFLDSTGASALVRLYHRCQADGCTLHLARCSRPVERVLRILGLYDLLTADDRPGETPAQSDDGI